MKSDKYEYVLQKCMCNVYKETCKLKKRFITFLQSSVALRSETKLDHGGQKMSNPQDVKDQSKDVAPTPGEGSRDAEEKKKKPKEAKPGGQEDIPPPNEEQDGEMVSLDLYRL